MSSRSTKLDDIIEILDVNIISGSFGGASAIGDGNGTVTTAGTAVQLSSQDCKRVVIFNNPANASLSNGGIIVVGGSTVVAAEATRRGATIFPGNALTFNVSNANLLYVDATDNACKFHFYYEN